MARDATAGHGAAGADGSSDLATPGCVLIGVDLKTVRRERPSDNPEVRLEMHRVAEKRRRFGYLVTPRPALATPEIDQHQTQGLSR